MSTCLDGHQIIKFKPQVLPLCFENHPQLLCANLKYELFTDISIILLKKVHSNHSFQYYISNIIFLKNIRPINR